MIAVLLAGLLTAQDAFKMTEESKVHAQDEIVSSALKEVKKTAKEGAVAVVIPEVPCSKLQALRKQGFKLTEHAYKITCGTTMDWTAECNRQDCTISWEKKK